LHLIVKVENQATIRDVVLAARDIFAAARANIIAILYYKTQLKGKK